MAQVGAFVRERMLEELLTGEVLEVRVVDPTLAYLFIGQGEDVLEQQKTDHEAGLDPGPALVAVERRDLAVEPFPIEFSGKLHQLVLQVDDLIEPGPGTDRSHPSSHASSAASCPPMRQRNHCSSLKGIPKMKLQGSRPLGPESLQSQTRPRPENRLSICRLHVIHRQLLRLITNSNLLDC